MYSQSSYPLIYGNPGFNLLKLKHGSLRSRVPTKNPRVCYTLSKLKPELPEIRGSKRTCCKTKKSLSVYVWTYILYKTKQSATWRCWPYVVPNLIKLEKPLEVDKDSLGGLRPQEPLDGARGPNVGLEHQVELNRFWRKYLVLKLESYA